jgi:acylphosphatase
MQRVEIIAQGDVQRVGFRDLVQKMGRDLGLSGTVENQEPYDVRIVAEGEEGALKEFIAGMNVEKGAIRVRELEVTWASATGEFPYFKILRGDWQEELGERFDVAVGLLHRSVELGEENLAIGRMMLDKQDTTISILKNIKEDTSEIGAIKEEVSSSRYEARREREEIISALKSGSLEEKYEQLSREIAEIKVAIAEIRAKVS